MKLLLVVFSLLACTLAQLSYTTINPVVTQSYQVSASSFRIFRLEDTSQVKTVMAVIVTSNIQDNTIFANDLAPTSNYDGSISQYPVNYVPRLAVRKANIEPSLVYRDIYINMTNPTPQAVNVTMQCIGQPIYKTIIPTSEVNLTTSTYANPEKTIKETMYAAGYNYIVYYTLDSKANYETTFTIALNNSLTVNDTVYAAVTGDNMAPHYSLFYNSSTGSSFTLVSPAQYKDHTIYLGLLVNSKDCKDTTLGSCSTTKVLMSNRYVFVPTPTPTPTPTVSTLLPTTTQPVTTTTTTTTAPVTYVPTVTNSNMTQSPNNTNHSDKVLPSALLIAFILVSI